MGWAHCGTDSKGREIGYSIGATCDHPGCDEAIDRGLAFACGGMHGTGDIHGRDVGCEGYFCGEHREVAWPDGEDGKCAEYCRACVAEIEAAHTRNCEVWHRPKADMGNLIGEATADPWK